MKRIIIKKFTNKITVIGYWLLVIGLTSCVDTIILPNDKTVEEDFWKTKGDVKLMVNGAYSSMLSENVIARLIVWGSLRSEELIPASTLSGTIPEDLTEISLANTQEDNTFADWSAFYSTINNCNLVLSDAAKVMEEDPSYTEGDYLSDCSQMLALRSLCYFYLVRNFRDVPYIDQAFKNSSQDRNIPQMTPDSVLQHCISDLETARKNAISPLAFNNWKRVGYMTSDAIDALLADIYLWRGSIKHDMADYQKAVDYCDKVIESKKTQHALAGNDNSTQVYPLEEGRRTFLSLYQLKNAEESIFELQFSSGVNTNAGVGHYLCSNNGRLDGVPYLYASSIFGFRETVYTTGTYSNDWRGLHNTYSTLVNVGELTGLNVRKYVTASTAISNSIPQQMPAEQRSYTEASDKNFIIYRLSDVMLMKAEALTAMAANTFAQNQAQAAEGEVVQEDIETLQQAFELVEAVNTRSRETTIDVIKWNTYNTSEKMEELILAERLRELAFEGKRWYDLLRYHYRHTDGTDYSTTLATQKDQGRQFTPAYQPMLSLMARKLGSKSGAVSAKMNDETKLYMPIPLSDLSICPVLRQNPGYNSTEDYNKNY